MALIGVNTKAKPLGTFRPPANDLGVWRMKLWGDKVSPDLVPVTTDLDLDMTVEGAGTLTLKVSDGWRELLRSKLLQQRSWVNLDNVEYMLVKVSRGEHNELTVIFEETAYNLLRQDKYSSPKSSNRDNTTRAQFIRGMVNEVTERRIPFNCPELNERQAIAAPANTVSSAMADMSNTVHAPLSPLRFRTHARHTDGLT